MAAMLLIKCFGYLLLWSAVVHVGTGNAVKCQNDCGYTLDWTAWTCNHCAENNNIATRVRGLCCKQETKDQCLSRCHKSESDISNKASCNLVCHQPAPLAPVLAAPASTTSAAPLVPVLGPITGNPTPTTMVPALGPNVGNPAQASMVPALGPNVGNPAPATMVPSLGSTTSALSPAAMAAMAAPGTLTTSLTSTSIGPAPAALSTSSSASNGIVPGALNPLQSTNVGAPSGMPVAASSSGPSDLTSTDSATLEKQPGSSNYNNNKGLCSWVCQRLKGQESCADDCSRPEAGNVCTILAVSFFFMGILIGAMLMAAIIRCCCHGKAHAQKHGSAKHRKTIMVGQYDSRDTPNSDRDVISTPQKEKRELRRVMELSKNRRQVSPFSSSANLVDSDWSLGDESPRVLAKRLQSSFAAADQVTEECETKSEKPTFFLGTTRPFSGVMRTPAAFSDGHVLNNGSGPVKPRGNVWLTD